MGGIGRLVCTMRSSSSHAWWERKQQVSLAPAGHPENSSVRHVAPRSAQRMLNPSALLLGGRRPQSIASVRELWHVASQKQDSRTGKQANTFEWTSLGMMLTDQSRGDWSEFDAAEIIPDKLYVGSVQAASHLDELRKRNITHVLSVADRLVDVKIPKAKPDIPLVDHAVVVIEDNPSANILAFMENSFEFIDRGVKGEGAVLVHCAQGVSRSVTIVTAYLMVRENLDAIKALDRVKASRKIADPNFGFRTQLRCLEEAEGDVDKAKQKYTELYKRR